jgi:TM2 domain-containing membrane protein YozV
MELERPTPSLGVGYLAGSFGFIGAPRFYDGKPVSGTIYFFTLGIFFIGWIVDFFLIPMMDREADLRYIPGPIDYNIAWLLLVYLGLFGVHRFYLGKIATGILYLLTLGFFGLGYIYDLWTLNDQISLINGQYSRRSPLGTV